MRIVDLSHILDSNTPVYPNDTPIELTWEKKLEIDYYNGYVLKSGLHTGTHLDIPMHLLNDNRTVEQFGLEQFMGNGVLLDVRGEMEIQMKPEYATRIAAGDIVILYTGWDEFYWDSKRYFDAHPVVSEELGAFLIQSRIKILGMDMPSPDCPPFVFHKQLLQADIFVLENLKNVGGLLALETFEIFCVPLKLRSEASLVRAFARSES